MDLLKTPYAKNNAGDECVCVRERERERERERGVKIVTGP